MREIEFRAKDLNGNWIFGFYSPRILFPSFEQMPNIKTFTGSDVEIEINTLGQYTGLKDKNGTKIFEGDIVKLTRTHIYAPTTSFHNKDLVSLHKIYWDEEKHAFYQRHFNIESERFIGGGSLVFNDERADENIIEIVGNIWDTPELLKGEK